MEKIYQTILITWTFIVITIDAFTTDVSMQSEGFIMYIVIFVFASLTYYLMGFVVILLLNKIFHAVKKLLLNFRRLK